VKPAIGPGRGTLLATEQAPKLEVPSLTVPASSAPTAALHVPLHGALPRFVMVIVHVVAEPALIGDRHVLPNTFGFDKSQF